MTTQDALNWINGGWRTSRFVRTIPGVGVGIDVDKLYGFQCKDFANGYADFMGAPFGSGNAIVLWRETQPGWHKESTPQVGDVFVRNYIAPDGMNYGDTGIVKEVLGTRVRVVQQNLAGNLWVGSPPAEAIYNQNIMLGYLRNDKIGGNMGAIKPRTLDIIIKAIKQQDPTAAELNDPNYLADGDLAVETFNNTYGHRRLQAGDVLNFMGAVYKLDISTDAAKKEAQDLAALGWKEAMYALAGRYQSTLQKIGAGVNRESALKYVQDNLK